MPFPKHHRIRGIRYKLRWRKPPATKAERQDAKNKSYVGKCYFPEPGQTAVLYIDPNSGKKKMDALELLDTVYHEGLHASFPDLSEEAVTEATSDIWILLKRMGLQVSFKN